MVDVGFSSGAFAFLFCVFVGGELGGCKDRLDFAGHFSGYHQ
jgi:hypothetical protein